MKLTKESKQLMEKFSTTNGYIPLKPTTISILTDLYYALRASDQYVKHHWTYTRAVTKISSPNRIPKPTQFAAKSFPEVVRKHIHETALTEIQYSFSLQDREVTVFFVLEEKLEEIDLMVYDDYTQYIATWLHMLNQYASKKCVATLRLYLYLTSLKKVLPSSNLHVLNETNVNTAFTTTCPKDSEIIVFRKEEWFKVFIHETFHNFSLDFSCMNNDAVHRCIYKIFPVASAVNAYEAYTEFWAEIINVIFCAYSAKRSLDGFLSIIPKYTYNEVSFSCVQLAKTLAFMGLNYDTMYSRAKRHVALRNELYRENTNVLSYYILKGVLMVHWEEFLRWCNQHNEHLLNFTKTAANQDRFCGFIKAHHATHQMTSHVDSGVCVLRWSTKKTKHVNTVVLTTMRMSVCELG